MSQGLKTSPVLAVVFHTCKFMTHVLPLIEMLSHQKSPVTMMEPQEIAAIEVTRTVMYGSLSVQRVGIYCLRHMLRLKENCVLIESENLLPYLVCLCWHLRKDEQGFVEGRAEKVSERSATNVKGHRQVNDGNERRVRICIPHVTWLLQFI